MILLTVILVFLLFGNWLINETLIFMPVQFFTSLTSAGWWVLGIFALIFLAWCVGDD